MVRSYALSPTSTVLSIANRKRDYTLRFQFSIVLVSEISNSWLLGGTALFIDLYGRVESLKNQGDSCQICVKI